MTMLLLFAGIAAFAMSGLLWRERVLARQRNALADRIMDWTQAQRVAMAAKAADAMVVKGERARMVRIMAASDEEAWNTLTAPERQP